MFRPRPEVSCPEEEDLFLSPASQMRQWYIKLGENWFLHPFKFILLLLLSYFCMPYSQLSQLSLNKQ